MTKNLILHFGPHKTASTSIQLFLKKNSAELRQAGLNYDVGENQLAHYPLAQHYLTGSPEVALLEQALDDKYVMPGGTSIVSCEDFAAYRRDEFQRLVEDLGPQSCHLIGCMRQPDRWLLSMWQQSVKTGAWLDFSDFVPIGGEQFSFQRILEQLVTEPVDRISLLDLESIGPTEVISSFLREISPDVPDALLAKAISFPPANIGMSYAETLLTAALTRDAAQDIRENFPLAQPVTDDFIVRTLVDSVDLARPMFEMSRTLERNEMHIKLEDLLDLEALQAVADMCTQWSADCRELARDKSIPLTSSSREGLLANADRAERRIANGEIVPSGGLGWPRQGFEVDVPWGPEYWSMVRLLAAGAVARWSTYSAFADASGDSRTSGTRRTLGAGVQAIRRWTRSRTVRTPSN